MTTWVSGTPPEPSRITLLGLGLVTLRGMVLAAWFVLCIAGFSIFRAAEAVLPIRAVSPLATVLTCRGALWILGLKVHATGPRLVPAAVLVSNHASWLDILVLNALGPMRFVSKSEVAGWPGIGILARMTGTVFIRRDPREARAQREALAARLRAGQRITLFPEGTSTDGMRVLRFKSTLFEAFFTERFTADPLVQPITLFYRAPDMRDRRFYGWWGDMALGTHLVKLLAQGRQGSVSVQRHPAIPVAETGGRKALAARAEATVRSGLEGRL